MAWGLSIQENRRSNSLRSWNGRFLLGQLLIAMAQIVSCCCMKVALAPVFADFADAVRVGVGVGPGPGGGGGGGEDCAQSLGGLTSWPFACPRIPWSSSCWS